MVDIYGIDPTEELYYRRVIEREKALRQNETLENFATPGVVAVMVVVPPVGWELGQCAILRTDARYPFCLELSIVGYPGFGVLDRIRGRIDDQAFDFRRDATPEEIRTAFPVEWRGKMTVTGGVVTVPGDTIQNPDWTRTSPPTIPRYITEETQVTTGRWFLGFTEEPVGLVFARTDEPTDAQIAALGFDANGDPIGPVQDEFGFNTNQDFRVAVRFREVPFICSDVPTPCVTLVDTSLPTPIAAGALAHAANVPGMGFSLLTIEPRVYQNLSSVFDLAVGFEDSEA